jgi:predicted Rossmann fold flavoprotein
MADALIIGAGAAGLMCAQTAGHRGRRVVVLERGSRIGAKVLISGGGRCNFTNLGTTPENFLSANPEFCKSALARYTPQDFLALVERHGIPWHEKKLGQLFCDRSSRDIVEMLRRECADAGVEIHVGIDVREVRQAADGSFVVATAQGELTAPKVVVATGGLSLPKLGATGFAYDVARQFGLGIVPTRPGLVPFTFGGTDLEFCRALSGISAPCKAWVRREGRRSHPFTEHFLFTHRGLSGPAALQVSSSWNPPAEIQLNLFPDGSAREWLEQQRTSGAQLDTTLARRLPARFVAAWTSRMAPDLTARPINRLRRQELDAIAMALEAWTLVPAGTEGYAAAEVTVGGVDTREISSRSMEVRRVKGLHFIGEAVDMTGWLGGYNFQWAWASASACGVEI